MNKKKLCRIIPCARTFEGPNFLLRTNIIYLIPVNLHCDYINFVMVSSHQYNYEWLLYYGVLES